MAEEKQSGFGGKFFAKIPKEKLLSPAGMVLFILAALIEGLDLVLPGGSVTIEIIPDLLMAVLMYFLLDVPLESTILPFLIERIPFISDILPTWILKMLM
jgi:hypothetical protein